MKQFIVLAAAFILLMFFPIQYGINMVNHYHMKEVSRYVHNAAQQARTDGRFTEENINRLKEQIANKLYIDKSLIVVQATTSPKYRLDRFDQREMISYEVRVPISKLLAMHSFFGFAPDHNSMDYVEKGEVASEVLMP